MSNTNTLYIPVTDDGSTSLNGLIVLFIHRWSGSNTRLNLVNNSVSGEPVLRVKVEAFEPYYNSTSIDSLTTTLPFLVLAPSASLSELIVSGSAAVCRHIVRSSERPEVAKVLGFRDNCLQAPAEVSVWTAYCEVQMPESARLFLTDQIDHNGVVVELPSTLVQLEEHLKQPIRMHNVVKRYQQENSSANLQLDAKEAQKCAPSLLDHAYAEGRDMTLSDLLLYPCVRLMMDRLSGILGVDVDQHLPRVVRWLSNMKPLVEQAWSKTLSDVDDSLLLDLSKLRIRPPPSIKIPRVEETSLSYRKDSKRPGVGNMSSEEIARVVELMENRRLWLEDGRTDPTGLVNYLDVSVCDEFLPLIDWSSLPGPAHPQQGHVPGSRLDRKIQQLDGMVGAVIASVSEGDVIVDFCSGGGHLGIVLAHLLPRCRILMVDNKEESVRQARLRLAQMGHPPNITVVQSNLDYFTGRFDLGVALHACGVATDLVLQACLKERAAFVLCPCCYGNLALPDLPVSYPQSHLFRKRGILGAHHSILARVADHVTPTGRLAMAAVDLDRVARAAEDGYKVSLSKLKPDSCSPKHDLLVGIPQKDVISNGLDPVSI